MAATVREIEIFPICMRELDVLRVEDVTPGMRRVTVGGPSMDRHVRDGVDLPPVRSRGFDDDVKLLPVDPTTGVLPFAVPTNDAGGTVDWPAGSFGYSRTYTVRRIDEDAREMVIDFALHEGGLAADWSQRVRPGEKILVAGPKHSAGLPENVEWMLLAGDETALPAIAHCLETLPVDLPATVVIEVAEPSHHQELTCAAPVDITWLYRSENDGESRLAATVQAVAWRPGQPYLWVAGETLTVKPLRRWAKHDKQIAKEFVEITGYWRRRAVSTVDGAAQLASASAESDADDRVHEMSELLPPMAIRTAVTIGLFEAIDAGAVTAEAVAAQCLSHPVATAKLLRHLTAMGMVAVVDERLALTELGSVLADPDAYASRALNYDKMSTRLDLAFLSLLETVRTGSPVRANVVDTMLNEPAFAEEFHEESAFAAVYRAPALPDSVDLEGVRTVAIYGEGAGVYADALARVRPGSALQLVGLPALNARNLDDVAESRRAHVELVDCSEFVALPVPVDLVIAVDMVDAHPDADARLLLRALGASSTRVVLVTDLLDPSTTDDHETEDDLRRLCLYGSGRRTEAELRFLITSAGGSSPRFASLGWGSTVVEFAYAADAARDSGLRHTAR